MANRATGWAAQKDQYAVPVMFNPYTGEPRDVRDVQSDPQGILIAPSGRVEMLAATPQPTNPAPAAQGDAEDAARYRCIRRGQHWSVIDGIGNDLRAEALDTSIDAVRSQAKEGGNA